MILHSKSNKLILIAWISSMMNRPYRNGVIVARLFYLFSIRFSSCISDSLYDIIWANNTNYNWSSRINWTTSTWNWKSFLFSGECIHINGMKSSRRNICKYCEQHVEWLNKLPSQTSIKVEVKKNCSNTFYDSFEFWMNVWVCVRAFEMGTNDF